MNKKAEGGLIAYLSLIMFGFVLGFATAFIMLK